MGEGIGTVSGRLGTNGADALGWRAAWGQAGVQGRAAVLGWSAAGWTMVAGAFEGVSPDTPCG